jgi:hypothetical protein
MGFPFLLEPTDPSTSIDISKSPGAVATTARSTAQQEEPLWTPNSLAYSVPPKERTPTPHACTAGLVFLTHTVFDEEIGDEVERLEGVPCRRCVDSR